MANACIASVNLADIATTVSVSGALALTPASRLLDPHVGNKCRVNATAWDVVIDHGSAKSQDTFMLAGVSGIDPTFRVRLSSADATGAAGDVYDSGSLTGTSYFDPDYALFVHLKAAAASARYTRIGFTEAGVDYTQAGRVFDGVRNQFGINFRAPWSRIPVRRSVDTDGTGGQTFVDLREGYWRVNASFEFVSETEANGFLEDIAVAIVNNGHQDLLWIRDPDSLNLSRDCVWGYHEGDWPRVQDLYMVPPVFSVDFSIRRRG